MRGTAGRGVRESGGGGPTRPPRACIVLFHGLRAYQKDPQGILGGAEMQNRLLTEAVGPHFDLQVLGAEVGELDDLPAGVHPIVIPVKATRPPVHLWALVRYTFHLWRALHRARADTYVARCASHEASLMAIFCLVHRRRFVYHWASNGDVDGHNILRLPWMAWLFRWARRRADLQVCQTRHQQELLRPSERRRSVVIPNVLDNHQPWRAAHDGSDVLWCGTIRPEWKRPDRFLDLAAALPHRRFRMAGDLRGPPDFQDAFRSRLAALPNVAWPGFVLREDLAAVYQGARVFVNTSDIEGFPNTFLEAAACGVPIVSLNVDPNGILAERGAGVFLDGDVARLPAAVESLFDDAVWLRHRKAALKVAADHRPDAILSMYLEALGAPREAVDVRNRGNPGA